MATFGEELRRERELRQISLREISEATKISRRYLEALERNEFDELPGGVFNRGFVRAYSQFIGVDVDSMVNAYLLEEQAQAARDAGGDGPVMRGQRHLHDRSHGRPETIAASAAAAGPSRTLRWVLLALALAAIASIVAWLLLRPSGAAAPGAARSTRAEVAAGAEGQST